MKMLYTLALCAVLLIMSAMAFAVEGTLTDLLVGKGLPLTLKLGSLDGNWMQMSVDVSANPSADQLLRTLARMRSDVAAGSLSFTKGETFSFNGETFLVAYQPLQPKIDMQAMMRGDTPPAPAPLVAETTLTLNLLNLRMVAGMREMQPVDLDRLLTPAQRTKVSAREQSTNNVRQLLLGIVMWAQDHDEVLPDADNVWAKIAVEKETLVHPVSKEPYLYNRLYSSVPLGRINDPVTAILVYEASPDEDGKRVVGYADGHTSLVDDAELAKALNEETAYREKMNQLQASLTVLRIAIKQFHADMGVYPKTLRDLIAKNRNELSAGYPAPKSYRGPYLPWGQGMPAPAPPGASAYSAGTIPGSEGIPANLLFYYNAPGYKTIGMHWNYNPKTGEIKSRVTGATHIGDTRWEEL